MSWHKSAPVLESLTENRFKLHNFVFLNHHRRLVKKKHLDFSAHKTARVVGPADPSYAIIHNF